MPKWIDIHHNFSSPKLRKEWFDKGFDYNQVKEWIDIGLSPNDADFVNYLVSQGYTAEWCLNNADLEELKEEYQENKTEIKNLSSEIKQNLLTKEEFYKEIERLNERFDRKRKRRDSIISISSMEEFDISNKNNSQTTIVRKKINIQQGDINLNNVQVDGSILMGIGSYSNQSLVSSRKSEERDFYLLQELKEHWKKINPNFDIYQFLDREFSSFNLWNATFEINSLKREVENLTSLVQQQKEKIVNGYLKFFDEEELSMEKLINIYKNPLTKQEKNSKQNSRSTSQELLRDLISFYLDFTRDKKVNNENAYKLGKKCNKVSQELEDRVGEEKMLEVQFILNDCERLVGLELELEEKKLLVEKFQTQNLSVVLVINNLQEKSYPDVYVSSSIVYEIEEKLKIIEEMLVSIVTQPPKCQIQIPPKSN